MSTTKHATIAPVVTRSLAHGLRALAINDALTGCDPQGRFYRIQYVETRDFQRLYVVFVNGTPYRALRVNALYPALNESAVLWLARRLAAAGLTRQTMKHKRRYAVGNPRVRPLTALNADALYLGSTNTGKRATALLIAHTRTQRYRVERETVDGERVVSAVSDGDGKTLFKRGAVYALAHTYPRSDKPATLHLWRDWMVGLRDIRLLPLRLLTPTDWIAVGYESAGQYAAMLKLSNRRYDPYATVWLCRARALEPRTRVRPYAPLAPLTLPTPLALSWTRADARADDDEDGDAVGEVLQQMVASL